MNNNINVLLDNRNEYVTYLEDTLAVVISEFFYNINLECNSLLVFYIELYIFLLSKLIFSLIIENI